MAIRTPPTSAANYVLDGRDGLLICIGLVAFLVHTAQFGPWMVDDAGISLAYARNLAEGHGLVSQPGLEAVEGYSDPLWVAIEATLFAIGGMAVPWTPKVIGATFAMLSLATIYVVFRNLSGGRRSVGFATLACLAASTPFVAWAVSGLENGLYVFWISSLLELAVRPVLSPLGN